MPTSDIRRQQLIEAAMANGANDVADVAIQRWQHLASQLISIIGEGGFNALYIRSVYLTQATHPWIVLDEASHGGDFRFINLKNSLKGQSATEASEASFMLILTFTNILASLIGEALTTSILSSAWGDNASDRDVAGKEFPHE